MCLYRRHFRSYYLVLLAARSSPVLEQTKYLTDLAPTRNALEEQVKTPRDEEEDLRKAPPRNKTPAYQRSFLLSILQCVKGYVKYTLPPLNTHPLLTRVGNYQFLSRNCNTDLGRAPLGASSRSLNSRYRGSGGNSAGNAGSKEY